VDYLLDTNFLIGLWREPTTGPEAHFLAANPDAALGIPWIVKAEFLAGAVVAGHALPRVAAFLADYPVVWADEDILMHYARLYARSRQLGVRIGPNDLWIGAAAVARGLPLLTRNVGELSRVEGLRIANYVGQGSGGR
jgi:tRNA(fMet)-specific endonuclease VapC